MKLYLKVLDRLIDMKREYSSIENLEKDYPRSIFETKVESGKLITRVMTENVKPRKEMKGAGKNGWYY